MQSGEREGEREREREREREERGRREGGEREERGRREGERMRERDSRRLIKNCHYIFYYGQLLGGEQKKSGTLLLKQGCRKRQRKRQKCYSEFQGFRS
jgi:hypothetical protein